ncbi:CrcB family protein [soil metagenome]
MNLVAVLIGGLVGTGMRLGIDALLPHGDGDFPLSTLVINVTGAFVLGMLVGRVWPSAPSWLRFGLGTGLLGSFTTFSALVASVFTLAQAGAMGTGLLYLAVTLTAGIAAAAAGLLVGRPGSWRSSAPTIGADE